MTSPRAALLLLLCLLLGTSASTGARQRADTSTAQVRPMQADAVVRLLTDLESAARRNDTDELRRLTSSSLAPLDRDAFVASAFGPDVTSVAIRERDRQPAGAGALVLVEMLVGRGRVGRIATWQLLILPTGSNPTDPHTIAGMTPVASVDGLVQLELDTTQQFEAKDLILTAPGLWVRLSSGVVFLAKVDAGPTALVFRGKGVMRFAPDDPAEQVQVRAFSGKPVVETEIEAAYFRVNPAEFASRFTEAQLSPVATPLPGDVARARQVFNEYSERSFTLNLGDLTNERWSLLPPPGDTLAELRTRRFGSLTYVRAGDDAEDVSLFDRQRGRNISVYASPERLATRGRFYSEDSAVPYDVEHYAVDVRIDPEREWISGRGSMRVRAKADGLSSLSLKLAESLAVTSVSSPEFGRVLILRVAGQSGVIVSLPRALERGTTFVLDVFYNGRMPAQQIDREALVVDVDGVPQAQPNPAGQQDLVVPAEPRFLYSNRTYWYPQAVVTDFATAALQVTVPAQYQVVGTGTLINNTVAPVGENARRSGDTRAERTVQFLADRPIRYSALIISRFVPVGSIGARVPAVAPGWLGAELSSGMLATNQVAVDVVATPRLARANRPLPDRVAEVVEYYASVIGEAPYPNFTLATLDAEIPSGHSPGYFAVWNQATLPTTLTWRGDPVALNGHPFFFLAHEVAHQWFGQAIGWKNYHEQWLSEGLAQYFAARYAGRDRGPEVERQLFVQMRESALDLSRHGPIHLGYRLGHVQNDGRIFRGLVYNKAAVVLHMLRRMIGAEAFDRGVRRFYATHRFQKVGTDDFRVALEAEAQVPLDRFFDRWILGFTLPEVRISWRMEPGGTHAAIRIEQAPGQVFDFPLTLTVDYGAGMTEQVSVVVTEATMDVRIPVPAEPRRIDARDDLGLVVVRR